MNLLDLAWRNLLRNRRRSALTLAAVAVGGLAIVIFGGYVAATVKGLQTDTVRQAGHLQIMRRGYLDFGRGDAARFAIRDYDKIIETLTRDPQLEPMLRLVTPLLSVQGVAGNFAASTSSNFVASGWRPAERRSMLEWAGAGLNIPPGASRLREDRPDAGVIGYGLAQLLGVCDRLAIARCAQRPAEERRDAAPMGADLAALATQAQQGAPREHTQDGEVAIELLAASAGGAPNVVRLQVLRGERQGVRELDAMYVALPLSLAQRLVFGKDDKGVSAIVIQLEQTAQIAAARARIEALLRQMDLPLEVQDFHAIQPQYDQVVGMFDALFRFIAVLMGVVTLFSVANAVNMSISERVGEIGTLRSLGFKRRHVRRLFLLEGGLIGLLGAALGVAAGVLIAEYGINLAQLSWTPPGRSAPVPIGIDALGQPALLIGAVVVLALLACVSAWWPAHRASRMEIVEALRHV